MEKERMGVGWIGTKKRQENTSGRRAHVVEENGAPWRRNEAMQGRDDRDADGRPSDCGGQDPNGKTR